MPSDIQRLTQQLEQLPEEIEDSGRDQIETELGDVKGRARRNLRAHDTNWNKDIYRSMSVVDTETGHSLVTAAPHAAYTEYGTGAYFGTSAYPVPSDTEPYDAPGAVTEELIDSIGEWVDTKPVIPEYYETQEQVTQAIAHTIAELGTQAHPYLRPAWYGHRQELIDAIERDITETVNDL